MQNCVRSFPNFVALGVVLWWNGFRGINDQRLIDIRPISISKQVEQLEPCHGQIF